MNLSDGEKLILVMLSEIYKKFGIKGEIDPEHVLASIYNNMTWGLGWKYPGVFNTPVKNPPEVNETLDILDMYRALTSAYEGLDAKAREEVDKESGHSAIYISFQGFDGNNDPHYGIVQYLTKDLGLYDELKGKELNSHSSATIHRYRRKLEAFKRVRDRVEFPRPLTAEQIVEILKA